MKRILNIFMKLVICISIFFMLIIIYDSLFNIKEASYLNKILSKPYILLWLISFILLLIIILIHKIINKINDKKLIIVDIICVTVLIVGQIFIIYNFNPVQITDSYLLNDQAFSIANGIEKEVDLNVNPYFAHYTNNNLCLTMTIYLAKIFKSLHIDYNLGLFIFNTIMIDIAILFTYLIGKKVKGKKMATELLVISVLNPINYLFITWTYTNTYSLPFMTCIVYLALLLKNKNNSTLKNIIYSVLFALVFVLGFLIRPVIIVPIIALIIFLLVRLIMKKTTFKRIIIPIVVISSVSILTYMGMNKLMKNYIDNGEDAYPVTHWIMMGLHGNGTFNIKDSNYTASFKTKKEKQKANIEEIKRTLEEYKLRGLLKHMMIKLPLTWSNGSSIYYSRMSQDNKQSKFYHWFVEGKNDLVIVYCQAFRIVTLLFCLICLLKNTRIINFNFEFFMILTVFGAIVFYLLWEAKTFYSVPFLPYLFILCSYGLMSFNKTIPKSNLKYRRIVFIFILLLTIIFQIRLFSSLTKKKISIKDYSVNITNNLAYAERINNLNKNNISLKQEFTSLKKFNTIAIRTQAISNDQNIRYNINLRNENNDLIMNYVITSSDIKQNYLYLKIDTEKTKIKEKYSIEIMPISSKNRKDTIEFYFIKSKATDNYKGVMYIDDKSQTGDLFIKVYSNKKEAYMSKKTYVVLSLLIIIIEYSSYYTIKNINQLDVEKS